MTHFSDVLAVVVVYQRPWHEVPSAANLVRLIDAGRGPGTLRLRNVIVYDNSPEPVARPNGATRGLEYHHDPRNSGTRGAYAFALERALQLGFEWVLVLDQDTAIPLDYLDRACSALRADDADGIAALLPQVWADHCIISPATLTRSGSIHPSGSVTEAVHASLELRLTGVASGSMIRTLALAGALPSARLWLDYVDHWIFRQLAKQGLRVAPFDAVLLHNLSIHRMSSMTRARLHSILDGELAFVSSLGWVARIALPFRWAARLLRLAGSHPQTAIDMLSWITGRRGA